MSKDTVAKDTPNPANAPLAAAEHRKRRIPMSAVDRRLEVEPLAGYHLHWIRETRMSRALDAGYELVDAREVHVNNTHTYGSLRGAGGNTDLGSNVSVVASEATGERLVLMKLREEDWREDSDRLAQRNARIMSSIFQGETIVRPDGSLGQMDGTQYTKALFNRAPRKIRLMGGNMANPAGINSAP